jgi:hypothetical protein
MSDIKLRYAWNQKSWQRNMDNRCINYLHCGQANDMYLIHMNKKCRIDRLGGVSKVVRF